MAFLIVWVTDTHLKQSVVHYQKRKKMLFKCANREVERIVETVVRVEQDRLLVRLSADPESWLVVSG